jgi:hypothetical protein
MGPKPGQQRRFDFTPRQCVVMISPYSISPPPKRFLTGKFMSVDAKAEVYIDRARKDVAAIMFDPKCERIWIGGLLNVFPLTPGMLTKGARVERVGDFLSKRFSAIVVVLRDDPESMVELSVNEPFEMKVRYQLTDVNGGTNALIRVQSIGEIEFQLPASMLNAAVAKKITEDLGRLKKHVEIVVS